jgi:light-regulated signal transduction histidine kinase (bacteriophytochrome)
MKQLIDDLLMYSRANRSSAAPQPVSLDEVLDAALANLAQSVRDHGATIRRAPLPVIVAERVPMIQLFQNLVGNALKFHGDAPPRVEVTARRTDHDMWLFTVSDNGIGVAPEYAERIFVIFQRLHGKEVYPGTGIGLAMCRKIIEYHGGTIWLDTTAETGARFCFTLPVRPEDEDTHDDGG